MLWIGGSFTQNFKPNNNFTFELAIQKTIKQCGNAVQMFNGDNVSTSIKLKESIDKNNINKIKKLMTQSNINVVIHSLLRLNYCLPPDNGRYRWGIENMIQDMILASKINAVGVVLHLGHKNNKFKQNMTNTECIKNFIKSVKNILKKTPQKSKVIIETTYNDIFKIGATIEMLSKIYNKFTTTDKRRIFFCVDTAHIFGYGYPIHSIEGMVNYFKLWQKYIGLRNIKVIHLNDSKVPLGSMKDRHQQLGKGYIFNNNLGGSLEALHWLVHFAVQHNWTMILETRTPKEYPREIKMVKNMSTQNLNSQLSGGGRRKNYTNMILNIFKQLLLFYKAKPKILCEHNDQYRIKQYEHVIKELENLDTPIYSISDIKYISGIGDSLYEKINEIINTEKLQQLNDMNADPILCKLVIFNTIHGVGPETAYQWILLGYDDIKSIKTAVKNKELNVSNSIEKSLTYYNDLKKKIPRAEMTKWLNYLIKLFSIWSNYTIELAGSYSMGKNQSKDIDLLIIQESGVKYTTKHAIEILSNNNVLIDIVNKSSKSALLFVKMDNKPVRHMDLRIINRSIYPFYILYFGSGAVFSRDIRRHAKNLGYKLTDNGLYYINGQRVRKTFKTKEEIIDYLNYKN
jgi:deoxyribonuclease IV